MNTNWQVAKSQRRCAVSGKIFQDGEEYFSVLKEVGENFERFDYAVEIWASGDHSGIFSFWKSRAAASKKNEQRPRINFAAVEIFFRDLAAETAPEREIFRYLLALLLARKRVLRIEKIERHADGGELLTAFDPTAGTPVLLHCPPISPEQLTAAQNELTELLGA